MPGTNLFDTQTHPLSPEEQLVQLEKEIEKHTDELHTLNQELENFSEENDSLEARQAFYNKISAAMLYSMSLVTRQKELLRQIADSRPSPTVEPANR